MRQKDWSTLSGILLLALLLNQINRYVLQINVFQKKSLSSQQQQHPQPQSQQSRYNVLSICKSFLAS